MGEHREWKFDNVALVLNDNTVCLLNVMEGPQLHELLYARLDSGESAEAEHKKTAIAIVHAMSPWLSTSLIWALRDSLAEEIERVNADAPRRTPPHPIDRP